MSNYKEVQSMLRPSSRRKLKGIIKQAIKDTKRGKSTSVSMKGVAKKAAPPQPLAGDQ